MTFSDTPSGQIILKSKGLVFRTASPVAYLIARIIDKTCGWFAKHKFWCVVFVMFEIWVHTLWVHHIREAVALAKGFGEITKVLNPF